MIPWLSNSTIARLRDQLRNRGQRPSIAQAPGTSASDAQDQILVAEYTPLCEAMYLMMSADGEVNMEEREVLRGALRNLSGDLLHQRHLDAMLSAAHENMKVYGRTARMQEVINLLHEDDARAEVAFVLAAAIAFADNTIADEENETLNDLAEGLGIDESRADQLLDAVESDLFSEQATAR